MRDRPGPERANSRLPVDVSDLRRLRRRSGISLREIADRTGIPRSLLLELEWGDFRSWPRGLYAEACLRAYAREARLPPGLVLGVVMPELADAPAAAISAGALQKTAGTAAQVRARRLWFSAVAAVLAAVFLLGGLIGRRMAQPESALEPAAAERVDVHVPPTVLERENIHLPSPGRTDVARPASRPAPRPRPGDTVRIRSAPVRQPRTVARTRTEEPAEYVYASIRSVERSAEPPPAAAHTVRPRNAESEDKPQRNVVSRAFATVGRTIVGDGTHEVKPFPRPRTTPSEQ